MTEYPLSIGIQAAALGGSFHEIAATELFSIPSENLVPFAHHAELVKALQNKKIGSAVIAVDNNVSGRVITAIDSLRGLTRDIHIIGSGVLPVEQMLLIPPDMYEEEIEAVMSQRPALDQCQAYIHANGLVEVPEKDTLYAAQIVAKQKGIINGKRTAAIASRLAGQTTDLVAIRAINDRPDNGTKFWYVSREKNWQENGTHVALTFDLPTNAPGALYRAVQVIAGEHNYDFTDFDSHLQPWHANKRSFFAELKRGTKNSPANLATALRKNNIRSRILGVYNASELVVEDSDMSIPPAISHDTWNARQGLVLPHESPVLHMEVQNKPKALLHVLGCLRRCNILDISRPTMPSGNNFQRGFYIVLDKEVTSHTLQDSCSRLLAKGFEVTLFKSKNGTLVA